MIFYTTHGQSRDCRVVFFVMGHKNAHINVPQIARKKKKRV